VEPILQSIRELQGVTAVFVFNGTGQVLGYQGVAIYDGETLSDVSKTLVKAVESVQLQMADWDTVTTSFEDGKLILRHLGSGADGTPNVLAVVAEAALNAPFVAVALRVAVQKLKKQLDGSARPGSTPNLPSAPPPSQPAFVPPQPLYPPPQAVQPQAPGSSPALAKMTPPQLRSVPQSAPVLSQPPPPQQVSSTGTTWSGFGSGTGSSSIEVVDQAAALYLTKVSRELARYVGPMSKIYVKEAARRVSPSAPFSIQQAKALLEDLGAHLDKPADRVAFVKAVEKP
jgi:hypothetical protein